MAVRKVFRELDAFDIAFNDYGPTWESLRRVAHGAVRKYSTEEQLALLVKDVVSETVDNIMKREGIGKAFVPFDYIYLTLLNILASSAFGVRFDAVFNSNYLFYFFIIDIQLIIKNF